MYEISIDELRVQAQRMLGASAELGRGKLEIRQVQGALSGLSGMGEVCGTLDLICGRIGRYSVQLDGMKEEADRITTLFEEMESNLKETVYQIQW